MPKSNRPQKNASWKVVGVLLAHHRRRALLTQQQLADLVFCDVESIASIEQGRRPLSLKLAIALDAALDAKGALREAAEAIPRRERYPAFVREYIELEAEALSLLSYENAAIPGLLQTSQCAAAVFANFYPPLPADQIAQQTDDRMARQSLFHRVPQPPVMHFVIEQYLLQRPIGGRDVLRGQLRHLREVSELPFIDLQIVPLDRETHAGLNGPMVLLETPDHEQLAYLEGQHVSFLQDDPDEVHLLHLKYGMLRSQALSIEDSKRLLDEMLGES
ncbi:helix-turn-helix transcriptional regulator [Streptomyces sp. A1136]|uniref:helix-turn-helix domain-containing protein n=1 Tax=Streptomyces sp. A1136 TaxID=2563102 RepID=UPI00109E887F|nr:helix-turn-helix transcriptional regulator [Streptomyces sp. A1136]THA53499.1 XRE family transcriptional regulator [Streptomyces sp. A1136]